MLVALLLRAAGVTRDAVVADYCLTDANMDGVHRRLHGSAQDLAALRAEFAEVIRATAAAIEDVLDRIEPLPRWLGDHGVTPDMTARWRDRLVG